MSGLNNMLPTLRAPFLPTQPKASVMWKVLALKYDDKIESKTIEFGAVKDVDSEVARALSFTGAAGEKSKVARADDSTRLCMRAFPSLSHSLPLLMPRRRRRRRICKLNLTLMLPSF